VKRALALLLVLVIFGSAIRIVIGENYEFVEFANQDRVETTGMTRELPSFGPETLEEIKKKPYVFEVYGKIPEFSTTEQRMRWLSLLENIAENVRKNHMLDRYFYPNGPVIAYGYDYRGYLRVSLEKNSSVNKTTLDSIYKAFDYHATKKRVRDVPVVFMFESFPAVEARDSYWRPIIGGVQAQVEQDGSTYSATVGFAAEDSNGNKGYVVSGHFGNSVDLQIWQPSISWWRFWYKAGKVAKVGGVYADASWVPYDNVDAEVYIADDDITGPIGAYGDPSPGLYVYKSGITTGLTVGKVMGKVTEIGHPDFGKLYDQWYADYDSALGDSGSPVYYINSDYKRELIGIHWGRTDLYAYFSPISGVQKDLGVTPLTK